MQLRSGDRVHTGFKAGVVLTFPDGSRLRVGPMTLLIIRDVHKGPEGGVHVRVWLRLGEVTAEVNRSTGAASDFNVKTPTTTTSSRGTVFSVFYDGTATTTTVTEHSVQVTAGNGTSVIVGEGMESRSTARSVAAPVPIGTGFKRGGLTEQQALGRLTAGIASGLSRCGFGVVGSRLAPAKGAWTASVVIVRARQGIAAKPKGTARFRVAGNHVRARNGLARRIARGCH
jgi:hypothetical protein